MKSRKSTAVSRIKQDYLRLKKDPVPYITAEPMPSNLLEWHYVVKGPDDSPYQGGFYHGTLLFPREFPFKPPSIYIITPNGRFKTNTRLCLSISDFHPGTWNPTWSVGTILTGLLSFMLENTPTLGSIESSLYEKQQYAIKSLAFNLKDTIFCELFPQICEEINKQLQKQQQFLEAITSKQLISDMIGSCEYESGSNANGDTRNYNNNINKKKPGGAIIDFEEYLKNQNTNKNSSSSYYCYWHSIYSNLIAIMSFAMFAFIVNYVIQNLN